jgi:twitching motility protein PilT
MQIIESLHIMLEESGEKQYPDIHLGSGKKPMIRNNNGEIEIFSQDFPILDNTMLKDIIIELSNTESFERFLENMELDSSYQFKNGKRYRVNCYIDSTGYSIALRLIPDSIPSMQEL